jgi:hypothetical protein
MEDRFFIGAQKIRCPEVKKAIQRLHGPEQHLEESVLLTFWQRECILAQTLCQAAHVLLTKATSRS